VPRLPLALAPLLFLALGTQAATPADDATPTAASVQELLALSSMHTILDQMATQYRTAIKTSMRQSFEGKKLNEDQQRIESDAEDKIADIIGSLLSWDTFGPIVVDVYTSTYTQGEVNDLIRFYKSPGGRAWVSKQPVAMQKTMALVQTKVNEMMPELKQLAMDTGQQLRAAGTPAGPAAPAAPAP
jgi:hypothetical protein